ncbi:jg9984 [Pararge aegeria aegeria]|uniref:Jg9984 protein n=1 Tax=Pararge aegeria aegeria TaxID=348720 RepID=A0A8S4SEA7_9NEOP|nr:jg9984 [Pararge aegeria aegeria]
MNTFQAPVLDGDERSTERILTIIVVMLHYRKKKITVMLRLDNRLNIPQKDSGHICYAAAPVGKDGVIILAGKSSTYNERIAHVRTTRAQREEEKALLRLRTQL